MRTVAIAALSFSLLACADAPESIAGPEAPSLELVDVLSRLDPDVANVKVLATFQVLASTPPRVLGIGGEEAAHFPGHPPQGPGTCLDGKWFNATGRGTSGTPDRPHPHCLDPGSDGATIVLEPISSLLQLPKPGEFGVTRLLMSTGDNPTGDKLPPPPIFAEWIPLGDKCQIPGCGQMNGSGTVFANAVDAATGTVVGTLKFPLSILSSGAPTTDNLFACSLTGDTTQDGCLNYIFQANYDPFPVEKGGLGVAQTVSGFLYWHFVN